MTELQSGDSAAADDSDAVNGSGTVKLPPDRLDNILNALVGALVAAILLVGGYFGYSVWANRQAALTATPALRVIQDLKSQVRQNPNESALRVRLGEALASVGEYGQAVEQLENALKLDENHSGAYMDLGLVAMLSDDYTAARRYFLRVVEITEGQDFDEINNRRDTALFSLGRIELSEGNYEEAVGYFKGSLRIRRDASDTYYYLARAYVGIDEPEAAIDQLEIALAFDPNFAQAHFLMGEIYFGQDDLVNASSFFYRAAELAPDADPPAEALASIGTSEEWEARGRKALEDGEIEEALKAALISTNLDPTRVAGHILHAEVLEARDDAASALKVYAKALDLAPENEAIQEAIDRLETETK